MRNDDRLRHAGRDGVGGIDSPDHLPLAAGVRPPAQGAGRAHEALEDLGVVRGVEEDDAHAGQHSRVHAFHDLVGDLVVGGVAPPRQDVGLGEGGFRQTVLGLLEGRDADADPIAELAEDAFGDWRVHALGIDLPDRSLAPLVYVLVPDRHANRAARRHQTGSASPVR